MKITSPTTTRLGETGSLAVYGADFKIPQDIVINFSKKNVRFLINKIVCLSNGVNTLTNGATVLAKEINTDSRTAAALSTSMAGANNDIVLTAVSSGVSGNEITLALIDPSENDAALSIEVTDTDIVVSLATGEAGAITTTATQLLAALAADDDAAALVSGALKGSDTGAGVVTALAESALTGGLDWVELHTLAASADLADSDKQGLAQPLTLASDREVLEGGNALLFEVTNGATAVQDIKDILISYLVV